MKVAPLAIDIHAGKLLFDPIEQSQLINLIRQGKPPLIISKEWVLREAKLETLQTTLDFATPRAEAPHDDDPRQAGWTYIVNKQDPDRENYPAILHDLAKSRGMADPDKPLIYDNEHISKWSDWYERQFSGKNPPKYVMILGGPDMFPFGLQVLLDIGKFVGRVAFDSLQDLKSYVNKIVKLEADDNFEVNREVMFFATDHGKVLPNNQGGLDWDPTHWSRQSLVPPIIGSVQDIRSFETKQFLAEEATKTKLCEYVRCAKPAVIFTASHGAVDYDSSRDEEWQKKYTGAIACQEFDRAKIKEQTEAKVLFSGDDVPDNIEEGFLEGSVFVQFACFGYGAPKETELSFWLDALSRESWSHVFKDQFISRLPKKLLAHPRGPVAYIGHVDVAMAEGFGREEEYQKAQKSVRIDPFADILNRLLAPYPVGMALERMNSRLATLVDNLNQMYVLLQRNKLSQEQEMQNYIEKILLSTDAGGYMLFGDPGVYIKYAEKTG